MISELNDKITNFLEAHGNVRTQEAWLQAYRSAGYSQYSRRGRNN